MPEQPVVRMVHAGSDGRVYWHGTPADTARDDAGTAIRHVMEGSADWEGAIVDGPALEWHWSRLDLRLRGTTSVVRVSYRTPYGESQEFTLGLAVPIWDSSLWDGASWTGREAEVWLDTHAAVGLAATGRWLVPRIEHDVRGDEFGVSELEIVAHPLGPYPRSR